MKNGDKAAFSATGEPKAGEVSQPGMTLDEYRRTAYQAAALQGIIARHGVGRGGPGFTSDCVELAEEYATAMLALDHAREKGGSQ